MTDQDMTRRALVHKMRTLARWGYPAPWRAVYYRGPKRRPHSFKAEEFVSQEAAFEAALAWVEGEDA